DVVGAVSRLDRALVVHKPVGVRIRHSIGRRKARSVIVRTVLGPFRRSALLVVSRFLLGLLPLVARSRLLLFRLVQRALDRPYRHHSLFVLVHLDAVGLHEVIVLPASRIHSVHRNAILILSVSALRGDENWRLGVAERRRVVGSVAAVVRSSNVSSSMRFVVLPIVVNFISLRSSLFIPAHRPAASQLQVFLLPVVQSPVCCSVAIAFFILEVALLRRACYVLSVFQEIGSEALTRGDARRMTVRNHAVGLRAHSAARGV